MHAVVEAATHFSFAIFGSALIVSQFSTLTPHILSFHVSMLFQSFEHGQILIVIRYNYKDSQIQFQGCHAKLQLPTLTSFFLSLCTSILTLQLEASCFHTRIGMFFKYSGFACNIHVLVVYLDSILILLHKVLVFV